MSSISCAPQHRAIRLMTDMTFFVLYSRLDAAKRRFSSTVLVMLPVVWTATDKGIHDDIRWHTRLLNEGIHAVEPGLCRS